MHPAGLLFGLFFVASGTAGIFVWIRLSGLLRAAPDGLSLGFDQGPSVVTSRPGADRVDYQANIGSPLGRRTASLLGIVVFIVSVGGLFALVLVEAGQQATKLIQHYILTSPSP